MLGLRRAGYLGAFAAFVGFTLPSAALMVALAYGASVFSGMVGSGILKGLVIAAVAIVAHAVLGMARSLTPDARRASIAVVAACLALVFASAAGQVIAIGCGVLAGLALCRSDASPTPSVLRFPVSRAAGVLALVLFAGLLFGLPVLAHASNNGGLWIADAFYRAGALVFGGGHVVLPLLESGVVEPGWVSESDFLAGYGAAQAVPGPLFTLAPYLGAASSMGPGGVAGAVLARGNFCARILAPHRGSSRLGPFPDSRVGTVRDARSQRRGRRNPHRRPLLPRFHDRHYRRRVFLSRSRMLRAPALMEAPAVGGRGVRSCGRGAPAGPLAQALAIGTEVARAILELRPHEGTIAPWAWGAVLAVSLK